MAVGAAGVSVRDGRPVHRGAAHRGDRGGAAGRREAPDRRGRPADGRAHRVLRRGPRRPRRPGLVVRPEDRAPGPVGLRLRRAVPQRGRGGGHQADLGAVPAPVPHRTRRRLCDDRGRAVRRARGRPPAVVVGGQPAAARRALGQRDRAGHPTPVVGVDPPAARRMAGRRRSVRGQPDGAEPDLAPPALAGRLPQPGLLGEQSRHRRGRRAVRRVLRVRLVPHVRELADRCAAIP